MVIGTAIFRCHNCEKIFKAPAIEYGATSLLQPMSCPECQTLSAPIGTGALYRKLGIIEDDT